MEILRTPLIIKRICKEEIKEKIPFEESHTGRGTANNVQGHGITTGDSDTPTQSRTDTTVNASTHSSPISDNSFENSSEGFAMDIGSLANVIEQELTGQILSDEDQPSVEKEEQLSETGNASEMDDKSGSVEEQKGPLSEQPVEDHWQEWSDDDDLE